MYCDQSVRGVASESGKRMRGGGSGRVSAPVGPYLKAGGDLKAAGARPVRAAISS